MEVVGKGGVAGGEAFMLDAGKTPGWAGATPLLGAFGCPKESWVAPAQQSGKGSVCEVFCPCPLERNRRRGGNTCRSSTSPPQHVKREYELEEPVALWSRSTPRLWTPPRITSSILGGRSCSRR